MNISVKRMFWYTTGLGEPDVAYTFYKYSPGGI